MWRRNKIVVSTITLFSLSSSQCSGENVSNKHPQSKPFVIGICGGSASGKTVVATAITEKVGPEKVSLISLDNYYRDLSHISMEERTKKNYDHPDAVETPLLIKHLKLLLENKEVHIPKYDFSGHIRSTETIPVAPRPIIIVEGLLIFADPELVDLMDFKIFVDTEDDIRFIRRLKRDTKDRGRTVDQVSEQYLSTVRPMQKEYIDPYKSIADVILPNGVNDVGIDLFARGLMHMASERSEKCKDNR